MSSEFSQSNQTSCPSNKPLSKRQYCANFISTLIQNPSYKPFLQFDDEPFGFSDAIYITRSKGLSLLSLREEILKRKQFSLDWLVKELTKIFIQISDYILLDDPLQSTCSQALSQIRQFQKEFKSLFSKRKNKKQPNLDKIGQMQGQREKEQRKQKRKHKTADFKSQLQMVYYLKLYQNDEQIVRKIGEVCNILSQNEEQFIFELGANSVWQDMIERSYD